MSKYLIALSLSGLAFAAPLAQGGTFDSLLSGLSGGSSGAGGLGALAGLFGGGSPAGAGGFDIGSLLGSLTAPGGVDSSVIIKSYSTVKESLDTLDKSVTALGSNSTSVEVNALMTKFGPVKAALKTATEDIKKQNGGVDLISSASLAGPGEEVTSALEKVVNDIIAKKDVIIKANAKAALVKELTEIKALTADYTGTIDSKLPSLSKMISAGSSTRPVGAINKALSAFT